MFLYLINQQQNINEIGSRVSKHLKRGKIKKKLQQNIKHFLFV